MFNKCLKTFNYCQNGQYMPARENEITSSQHLHITIIVSEQTCNNTPLLLCHDLFEKTNKTKLFDNEKDFLKLRSSFI